VYELDIPYGRDVAEVDDEVLEGEIVDDECDDCGGGGAQLVYDPIAAEVDGEDVLLMLCDGCYQIRADDA